jgi:hypothetical protein
MKIGEKYIAVTNHLANTLVSAFNEVVTYFLFFILDIIFTFAGYKILANWILKNC